MALAPTPGECFFFKAPREIRNMVYKLSYVDAVGSGTFRGRKGSETVTLMLSEKATTIPKGIYDILTISDQYLEEALHILIRQSVFRRGSVSSFGNLISRSNAIKENITSIEIDYSITVLFHPFELAKSLVAEKEYKASIAEVVSSCPRLVTVAASVHGNPILNCGVEMIATPNWYCKSYFHEVVRQLKTMRGLKQFVVRTVRVPREDKQALNELFEPIEAEIRACVKQDRVPSDVAILNLKLTTSDTEDAIASSCLGSASHGD
ncbi:hypothetical protein LTR37_015521 [Vermiconidia calcicola]|uniref:Uncharacterized protein n=1 Tax=Vermiconidia calcicola TaxID=1690605 RepID=A0ACC3MRQ8_9PEZI|nr:hypothetical protein LTR37_015521 [Vermiconidia calcicola]